ncbi:hypothetical protein [Muribaculum intestinale]|uniref:hypothetical protein n=1 Tax=Muribaculum intestinale TaxID=1796646 RepID=UPI0024BA51C6|nr:hypothetical protein [Muribaculum intestinale]
MILAGAMACTGHGNRAVSGEAASGKTRQPPAVLIQSTSTPTQPTDISQPR